MSYEAILLGIGLLGGFIATCVTLAWFIFSQLSETRRLIYTQFEKLIVKLEYHEQHDDLRFAQIAEKINDRFKEQSDRIWNIELRNAAKDGVLPHEYKKN